jgi:hypothetical protein
LNCADDIVFPRIVNDGLTSLSLVDVGPQRFLTVFILLRRGGTDGAQVWQARQDRAAQPANDAGKPAPKRARKAAGTRG